MTQEKLRFDLCRHIEELLGLHFPLNRWSDLERGLKAAAKEVGFNYSLEAMSVWLNSNQFSKRDLDILSNHLTIGETYFFRDPDILDAFKAHIIPELLTKGFEKEQQIRIWSAGCCTGEEPYTIAMLLLESVPNIANWNITIYATDINPIFLEKAEQGIYGVWSFRGTPPYFRDKYFIQESKGYRISNLVRQLVKFDQLNLKTDLYLSAYRDLAKFDVIFCRNVLMYFSSTLISQIGKRFYESLNPFGWFITSAVELNDDLFPQFSREKIDQSFLYRKKSPSPVIPGQGGFEEIPEKRIFQSKKAKVSPTPPPQKKPSRVKRNIEIPESDLAHAMYEKGRYDQCVIICNGLIKKGLEDAGIIGLMVRSLANLGKLDEALDWGRKLIEKDRLNVNSHYLMAHIFHEIGDHEASEQTLKQALFLENGHILSNLLMGILLQKRGKREPAKQHFSFIRKSLESLDGNKVIDDKEGLTVYQILEMIDVFNDGLYVG